MSEVMIGGHLGYSNHETTEFKISVDRKKCAMKTSNLDMRTADFRRLRELVSKVHWKMFLNMLGSISAGHFSSTTSKWQFQKVSR